MFGIWKSICSEVSYTILGRVESVLFVLVIAPPVKRWGSVYLSLVNRKSPPKRAGVEDGDKLLNVFRLRKVLVELDSLVHVFSIEINNVI